MNKSRGFIGLSTLLIILLGFAAIGAGVYFVARQNSRVQVSDTATTTPTSPDTNSKKLPYQEGNTVVMPSMNISFTLPSGWKIAKDDSSIGSSIYNEKISIPYVGLTIADSEGKVVARVGCPPPARGMEQWGELYDDIASSTRTFVKNGITYSAGYDFVVNYDRNHKLDPSQPRVFMSFVGNGKPLVDNDNSDLQNCLLSDGAAFGKDDINGLISIYNSWR